jgi:hypothetical protein
MVPGMTEREHLIMNARRLEWLCDAGGACGASSLSACGGAKEQLILLPWVVCRVAKSPAGNPHDDSTKRMPPAIAATTVAAPPTHPRPSGLGPWPTAATATP